MAHVIVYDTIHANVPNLPSGMAAGYTTGSSDIRWTDSDWAAKPGAVRICQAASASDVTADVLDVEQGAASPSDCPGWYRAALDSFNHNRRPGQRRPAIYGNQSDLPNVAAALKAAGITSGPVFWLAKIVPQSQAEPLIGTSYYGYPIIGVQFDYSSQVYDRSVFDTTWLNTTSDVKPTPKPLQGETEMMLVAPTGYYDVYLVGGPQGIVHVRNPQELQAFAGLPIRNMPLDDVQYYFGTLPNTPTPVKN